MPLHEGVANIEIAHLAPDVVHAGILLSLGVLAEVKDGENVLPHLSVLASCQADDGGRVAVDVNG